jgi:hypothetical protein
MCDTYQIPLLLFLLVCIIYVYTICYYIHKSNINMALVIYLCVRRFCEIDDCGSGWLHDKVLEDGCFGVSRTSARRRIGKGTPFDCSYSILFHEIFRFFMRIEWKAIDAWVRGTYMSRTRERNGE